jgi:hypothetical protein
MRSKWIAMVVAAVCAVLLLASITMAQGLVCISQPDLKGEKTITACATGGETFVYMDGKTCLVRVLTTKEPTLSLVRPRAPKYADEVPQKPEPRIGDQLKP